MTQGGGARPVCVPPWIACVVLVAVVACLVFAVFPLEFLDGRAMFWRRATGDAAQHIIGGRYFIADAWRWPLLFVPGLGSHGTNIGLTDSIPLAALIAKLSRAWWGFRRPYLPVWILACWLAQGPAGALVLWQGGVRRIEQLVLGGLLLVFTPVLLAQFEHAALCGQFLILLALAIHLASVRAAPRRWAWAFYPPLLVAALLVHIYLLAMVTGIALATLLHGLWTERMTVPGALGRLGCMVLPVAGAMGALGYFAVEPMPLRPYGRWAFNLAAPFVPGSSLLTGIVGPAPWFGGESYAWVGAGVAGLVVLAAIVCRRNLRDLAARHGASLVMAIAVVVYAASFAVRLGPWTVLGFPFDLVQAAAIAWVRGEAGAVHRLLAELTPWAWARILLYVLVLAALAAWLAVHLWRRRRWRAAWFLGLGVGAIGLAAVLRPLAVAVLVTNFQASERFVWIDLYLLVVLAIAGLCRALPANVASVVLALALVAQVADTAPLWQALRRDAVAVPPALPGAASLAAALARAREVRVAPTYLCARAEPLAPGAQRRLIARITAVDLFVSRWALPTDSVRNSRMSAIHRRALARRCAAAREADAAWAGRAGRVTLVLAGAPAEAALRQRLAGQPGCATAAIGVVCVAQGFQRQAGASPDRRLITPARAPAGRRARGPAPRRSAPRFPSTDRG